MKQSVLLFLIFAITSLSCRFRVAEETSEVSATASTQAIPTPSLPPSTLDVAQTQPVSTPAAQFLPGPAEFTPQTVLVGDPTVNYSNVEFTADMQTMVWFEMTDREGNGVVWHCGVDSQTGDLIPADGKGFRAFESTILGRGNPGFDSEGAYYVGMDRSGKLLLVRPTGPTSGSIQELATPPDLRRRGFYPTVLPEQKEGYVFWILNENIPAGATDPRNAWVELQYISLSAPQDIRPIEHQDRPRGRGFAPLDAGFVRWMRGKPAITYGFRDESGVLQVRMFDLSSPNPVPQAVTNDPVNKIDPYGWYLNGQELLIPGIDAQARIHVYTRTAGQVWFTPIETIVPPQSRLPQPALAQSAEPILFAGQPYIAYQINDAGKSFWEVTFDKSGEIWLSTILQSPQQQWLLSDSTMAKAEPEPFFSPTGAWVFYNATEGDNLLNAIMHLYRAKTPLGE